MPMRRVVLRMPADMVREIDRMRGEASEERGPLARIEILNGETSSRAETLRTLVRFAIAVLKPPSGKAS